MVSCFVCWIGHYFEMGEFSVINELYNCLDLYIVSSRYEGGPQSVLECGITRTPIISTRVGIADEILSSESLYSINNFENVFKISKSKLSNSKK